MYIELDKTTRELQLNLPDHLQEYNADVQSAVMEEFAFEPINLQVLGQMNLFICRWFEQKGIDLPYPQEENKHKGVAKDNHENTNGI
jgi:hypothetical protein